MRIIIQPWLQALFLLKPRTIANILQQSTDTYIKSFLQFMHYFAWIVVLDTLFLGSVGDIIHRATQLQTQAGKGIDATLLVVTFIHSIAWFIVTSAFFLLIRKNDVRHPKEYFRIYFYRYVQLLMTLSFIFLIFIYLLISLGISKLPTMSWPGIIIIKIIEIYTAFYWLDADNYFINIPRSFEKSINLLFYNAPFFGFFIALIYFSDYGLSKIFSHFLGSSIPHCLFSEIPLFHASTPATIIQMGKILVVKYSTFLIECFLISIALSIYRRKYREVYSKSLFDESWEKNI